MVFSVNMCQLWLLIFSARHQHQLSTKKVAASWTLSPNIEDSWKLPLQYHIKAFTLWWTNILLWKITIFNGILSTISMAIFNCYVSSPEGKASYHHETEKNESLDCLQGTSGDPSLFSEENWSFVHVPFIQFLGMSCFGPSPASAQRAQHFAQSHVMPAGGPCD